MEKVEIIQYQAALAVTSTWKGSSRTNLYEELGWESYYLIAEDVDVSYRCTRLKIKGPPLILKANFRLIIDPSLMVVFP